MNTNVPDSIVAELKKDAETRVAESLDNISKACKVLLKNNEVLTYKSVGEYCRKEYGKPSVGTINNDASKIYKRVINEYKSIKEKENSTELIHTDKNDGLPLETIIYINNLEERLLTLENILKIEDKKFRNDAVISLEDTLDSIPDSRGHVSPAKSTHLTAVQQRVIEELAASSCELKIRGKGNRRIVTDTETGEIVVHPSELASLLALTSQ
ncbi:MAG: hypothetical protein CBB67_018020 [Alteromonadaceae bacterium TMED7]|nr:hypothetical protein [Alteromonadaceae bacterium]RPH15324.1 MAG: hypothetical protein CBB67_018020 [Alteromonadaceae bacterium TMED7]|tara:strand:+ start:12698 stop:13333 length:636 start_codon:yes stop_codon:yes gene_type:complete